MKFKPCFAEYGRQSASVQGITIESTIWVLDFHYPAVWIKLNLSPDIFLRLTIGDRIGARGGRPYTLPMFTVASAVHLASALQVIDLQINRTGLWVT